ncbi:MAG TPA: DUF2911 domain-containing protein [Terriglobales bacterium]
MVTLRLALAALLVIIPLAYAQDPPSAQTAMSYCTFADDNQLTVRYGQGDASKKGELPNGRIWTPGDVPMLLFTQVPIVVASTEIPVGAYSMYVIPEKEKWTLIVNKNVTAGSAYDQKQDLVRVPMDTGKLGMPQYPARVSLGHIAPKTCSLRVDYGKTGAWADAFKEK